MSFRWISMFAGAGCGDLGLHRAGHDVVAAIENDKQAAGVFAYNFPNVPIFSDIKKVIPDDLPDCEGVLYSFPCQDLSHAGRREGFDGERSTLYEEAIRIIQPLKDRGLRLSLAENVLGLLSSNSGSDFEKLLIDLLSVGHTATGWTVLDSQHLAFSFPQSGGPNGRGERRAVPQRRKRVFVLGTLGNIGGDTIAEIFSLKHRIEGYLDEGRGTGKNSTSNIGEGSEADGRLLETQKFYQGNPAEESVCRTVCSKWHKGSGGPSGDETGNMVVENYDDLTIRRITPLECERLQGLPDNFTKYREVLELADNRWVKTGKTVEVSDTQRYKILGNGITAHVMEWIARRISLVLGV